MFNVAFNNISVISRRSVILVEETGVPGEKTTDLSQVTDKLSHNVVSPEWDSNYDHDHEGPPKKNI